VPAYRSREDPEKDGREVLKRAQCECSSWREKGRAKAENQGRREGRAILKEEEKGREMPCRNENSRRPGEMEKSCWAAARRDEMTTSHRSREGEEEKSARRKKEERDRWRESRCPL